MINGSNFLAHTDFYKMTTIYIIHGLQASSKSNWIPWLKQELEKLNHTVITPDFPNSNQPQLQEWLNFFTQYPVDEKSIVIGHSLGTAFLLRFLEDHKAKAAFFVAGVPGPLQHDADAIISTFSHYPFNWKKIKQNCKYRFVIHSDNDPYIPLKQAQGLSQNIDSELILIKGAKHLNRNDGYLTFPLLLEKIREQI